MINGEYILKVVKYSDFEFTLSYLLISKKLLFKDDKANHIIHMLDPNMNADNVNENI